MAPRVFESKSIILRNQADIWIVNSTTEKYECMCYSESI
jgi:hypothetical protein